MKNKKKSPPQKKGGGRTETKARLQTSIRVDPELWAEATRIAEIQHSSVASVLEQCLEKGLPRLEKLLDDFHSDK
jgi:predicted HicB family RNase H-like nuclease